MPTNRREYMREYMRERRAQKKREAAEAAGTEERWKAGLDSPVGTHTGIVDMSTGETRVLEQHPERPDRPLRPKPAFLVAPNDDCIMCGHGWHNEEEGCREPVGKRRCGCKLYASAAEPPF